MTDHKANRHIVVGVTPKQPPEVVGEAARIARKFDAILVCANVDAAAYVVAERPDGSVESRPIDPDQPDWDTAVFDGRLVSWNLSSFALGVVQVRASQGRRGRDTGSYVDRGERGEVRAWAVRSVKRLRFHATSVLRLRFAPDILRES